MLTLPDLRADAFDRGVQAYRDRDLPKALKHFQRAAARDEGMADAWAGVIACGGDQTLAVAMLAAHADRFGEEFDRTGGPIPASIRVGRFGDVPLDHPLTAFLAVAEGRIASDRLDEADAVLRGLPTSGAKNLLAARIATLRGQSVTAETMLTGAIDDPNSGIQAEARLLLAEHKAATGDVRGAHLLATRIVRGACRAAVADAEALLATLPEVPVDEFASGITPDAEAGPLSTGRHAESVDTILAELDSQIGMGAVKRQVRKVLASAEMQHARKAAGLGETSSIGHLVFAGPAGTGKTTVARIIARLLHAAGITGSDAFIETDRSGLVGEHIGETAKITTAKIGEAMGGVLFVDEAYSLFVKDSPRDFGKEAIDTLLKRMEDDRGRFLVIAAGYPDEMRGFLDSNPGLKSRFTTTIEFENYSPGELLLIADGMVAKSRDRLSADARIALSDLLVEVEKRGLLEKPSFGNARWMRSTIEKAQQARDARLFDSGSHHDVATLATIEAEDIVEAGRAAGLVVEGRTATVEEILAEMDARTGMQAVKDQVRALQSSVRAQKAREAAGLGAADAAIGHMLFTGPAGTGKTTTARDVARLCNALGLLPTATVIEVDRSKMVGAHVGETALKTNDLIDRAMGGVLFIDEAYALVGTGGNDFGREAIDTLVKRMEDDRGRFLVIAAGYPEDMRRFVASNPGLPSRFPTTIDFPSYAADELAQIADEMVTKGGSRFSDAARLAVVDLLDEIEALGFIHDDAFGNARWIRNLIDKALAARDARLFPGDAEPERHTPEVLTLVEAADIRAAAETLTQRSKA